MSQRITINVHLREMLNTTGVDRLYKVVIEYEQGGNVFTDDNGGMGYSLYKAEHVFVTMEKICAGDYEIPTKVVRCDSRQA